MSDSSNIKAVMDATTAATAGQAPTDPLTGFAPDPKPHSYGFSLGHSTGATGPQVKVMREAYEDMPRLAEVVEATLAQEQALDRRPVQTTLGDLSLDPETFRVRREGKPGVRILGSAFRALINRVPRTVRPDHAAGYISSLPRGEWMAREFHAVRDLAPSQSVTAHLWRMEGEWQIYAISSADYTPYPPALLVRDLSRVKGLAESRCQCLYTPLNAQVQVVKDASVAAEDLGAGEAFRHVTGYRLAENLSSSVVIYEKILRSLCTNLAMCSADRRDLVRRRHIGSVDEISDHVVRVSRSQASKMEGYLDNYREGCKLAVPGQYLADVVRTLTGETAGTKRRAWLEVAGVKPAGLTMAILTAHARERDNDHLTRLHNAITRAAHETPWPSLEGGEGLEQQATALLFNSTPVRIALETAQQHS